MIKVILAVAAGAAVTVLLGLVAVAGLRMRLQLRVDRLRSRPDGSDKLRFHADIERSSSRNHGGGMAKMVSRLLEILVPR